MNVIFLLAMENCFQSKSQCSQVSRRQRKDPKTKNVESSQYFFFLIFASWVFFLPKKTEPASNWSQKMSNNNFKDELQIELELDWMTTVSETRAFYLLYKQLKVTQHWPWCFLDCLSFSIAELTCNITFHFLLFL